jgi:hypothetical protein
MDGQTGMTFECNTKAPAPTPQRPLTQAKCRNPVCRALIEMQHSLLERSDSYLYRTATGADSIAVVCSQCKHVYPYTIAEFYGSGMTDMLDPFRIGRLNLFHVYLECENKDCDFLTGAWLPTSSSMKIEEVRAELELWEICELICRCEKRVLSPKQASLRQNALDFAESGPGT